MLYNLLLKIVPPLFRVLFRFKVKGSENIPPKGGVLICSNHLSYLDPLILGAALPRPAYYMARKGLFRNPLFGWLIRILNAFPIQERFFKDAFKRAEELINEGKILILYPEGTRSKDGRLGSAKGGVGMLVTKIGNIPVIPTKIIGTEKALPRGRFLLRFCPIEVRFGRPLYFKPPLDPSKETYFEIAQTIMSAIGKL